MVIDMKENIKIVLTTVMVYTSLQMAIDTLVNGKRIKYMVEEHSFGLRMVVSTKEKNGRMARNMVMAGFSF